MDFVYEYAISILFGVAIAMGIVLLFFVKRQGKNEAKSKKN